MRPNKYNSKKTVVDGITFDSKAEAERYSELKIMQRANKISSFKRQPSFVFDSGVRYRPDFIVCGVDGKIWVEDVKGFETSDFKIKKKLWEDEYWWMPLHVIKR